VECSSSGGVPFFQVPAYVISDNPSSSTIVRHLLFGIKTLLLVDDEVLACNPRLRRLRQEDQQFEASLCFIV
jgi:hypothetical protein